MKHFRKILLIICLLPCIFLLNACSLLESNKVYVVDIKQTGVVGTTTTYTIYYSDGTTALFTIENGQDGEDLSVEDLYNKYLEENPGATYDEFLQEYLTINQDVNTVKDATNLAIQSAVTIWCEFPTSGYMGANKNTDVACGSGVIYKMEETYSYIITNYHVVYMDDCDTDDNLANKIHIFQYGTSETVYKVSNKDGQGNVTPATDEKGYPLIAYGDGAIEATYVGGALNYDLAVIKVPTEQLLKYNSNAKAVTVANKYNLGETAIAIGNPECEGFSVTSGIISVVSETIEMTGADETTECEFRVMRIDTAVNGGNSGGGLFNIKGELIGIVNAKVIASGIDNIAYALPHDNITAVANNIIHYHKNGEENVNVKKLVLDLYYTVENSRGIYNPETNETIIKEDIVVASTTENGVAHIMGFKENDIIKSISINGTVHTISRGYELGDLLLTIRAGDKIIISVVRNGFTVSLGLADENGVLASQLKIVE